MGQAKSQGYKEESAEERGGNPFVQEKSAQKGGGDGAQRQESGDPGWGGMIEGPKPEIVPDAAAHADKNDRQPAAGCEMGEGSKQSFGGGKEREKNDRGEHGKGA